MSHHTYTHNIFEEIMCVLSTGISGRCGDVFYVSEPACCYSRMMPDHTWHVLPLNTYVKITLMSWMTGRHSQLTLTQLNIAGIILRKESESSNWALSGTFRLPSEESGKGLPQGYIRRLVRSMRRRCDAVFRTNGGHKCY